MTLHFFKKSSLEIFLFHSLFSSHEDLFGGFIDVPQNKAVTKADFKQFIEEKKKKDYVFVSPGDLLKSEWRPGKYALITFDDGYYNNVHALPILNEYQIPAIFFFSTSNILEGKSFWWDVLFRERNKLGVPKEKIARERQELKKKTHTEIKEYLTSAFGEKAFQPLNDIERPFTSDELKEFSKSKYVYFGNHTRHHAILTNYPKEGIKKEILGAEDDFKSIGIEPIRILAYPNGNFSNSVLEVAGEIGIELGMIVNERNVILPLRSKNKMILGRVVPSGTNV